MKAFVFIIAIGVVWASGLGLLPSYVQADTATSPSFILIDSFSFGSVGTTSSSSTSSLARGGIVPSQGGTSSSFKTAGPLAAVSPTATSSRTSRGTQAFSGQSEQAQSPPPTTVAPVAPPVATTPKPSEPQPPQPADSVPQPEAPAPSAEADTTQPPATAEPPSVIERAIDAVIKPVQQLLGGGARSSEQRHAAEPQQIAKAAEATPAGSIAPSPAPEAAVKPEDAAAAEKTDTSAPVAQPVLTVPTAPIPIAIQKVRTQLVNTQQKIVRAVRSTSQAIVQTTKTIGAGVTGAWKAIRSWFRWAWSTTTSSIGVLRAWAKSAWQPRQAFASVKETIVEDLVGAGQVLPTPEPIVGEDHLSLQEQRQEEWDIAQDQFDLVVYGITVQTEVLVNEASAMFGK